MIPPGSRGFSKPQDAPAQMGATCRTYIERRFWRATRWT